MCQKQDLHQMWAAIFLVIAAVLAPLPSAQAGCLNIVVEDVRSEKGNVVFALHRHGDPFPDKVSPYLGGFRRASVGPVSITFCHLLAGRYALALVHDENLNRLLDTNRIGLPTEGFGFSNNARPMLEPPSFKDASFEISTDGEVTQSIRMIYLPGSG